MTRRAFVSSSGLALLATGVGGVPTFLATAAQATPKGPFQRRKVLVTIFQRGAMDGLAAVQPLSDPLLSRLRPTLALDPRRQLVDLDGRTDLPGLYAAGDCVGGLNPTAELGGMRLCGGFTLGRVAGRAAAEGQSRMSRSV